MIEQKTCEEFYEEVDRNGVGGLLLLFVIWLILVNPLFTVLNINYVIGLIRFLSDKLHYVGVDAIYYTNLTAMVLIVIAGIILGVMVNRIRKGSLEMVRGYLLIQAAFLLIVILSAFPVIMAANDEGILILYKMKVSRIVDDMVFRIWTSLAIFCGWYVYLGKSKRVKSLFYPERCE